MHYRLLFILIIFCIPLWSPIANASPARDAFAAVDRKQWSNALAAARRGEPELLTTIKWLYLQDSAARASFQEITAFIRKHPNWPRQDRLRVRAEQSLQFSDADDDELKAWFERNPPLTGLGKVKYAELLLHYGASLSDNKIQTMLREAWRDGDFEDIEEKRLDMVYADILRQQDHFDRASRLLWEEKTRAARRMLSRLSSGQQAVVEARAALINDDRDASFRVSRVPPQFLNDPGLMYDRLKWRIRHGDDEGAKDMLLDAPKTVPYPEKWWRLRSRIAYEAITGGYYQTADKLLKNHGQVEGAELADALWLRGWVSLEFLHDPEDAYLQFYEMYDAVNYPVSKARAAYWAGRAAEKTGNKEAAESWYATAASYPTTFYGQAASSHYYDGRPLSLPAEPVIHAETRRRFENNDRVAAIRIAAGVGAMDTATALLYHLIDTAKTPSEVALATELGKKIHHNTLSVRGAKRAMQQNVILYDVGYPMLKLPSDLAVEPALALAISRQESEFDPHARSSAGALGMMQLLPGTARDIARKTGTRYSAGRLYEPAYNITLGSAYINRLMQGYDGSYVLAIAAYNAGPGNVRKWLSTFGPPGGNADDIINWIEKIPFPETRNYVQRVIENLQMYRHLLAKDKAPQLQFAKDLMRGQ